MKLIAESGSTRTEWALVEDNHLIQIGRASCRERV